MIRSYLLLIVSLFVFVGCDVCSNSCSEDIVVPVPGEVESEVVPMEEVPVEAVVPHKLGCPCCTSA